MRAGIRRYLVCAVSGERLPFRGGVCLAHQAGDSEMLSAGINPLTEPGRTACEVKLSGHARCLICAIPDEIGMTRLGGWLVRRHLARVARRLPG